MWKQQHCAVLREDLQVKNVSFFFLHLKQLRCTRKERLYGDVNNSLLSYSPDYPLLTRCNLYQMCFTINWELLCLCTALFRAPVLQTVWLYCSFFLVCSEILLMYWNVQGAFYSKLWLQHCIRSHFLLMCYSELREKLILLMCSLASLSCHLMKFVTLNWLMGNTDYYKYLQKLSKKSPLLYFHIYTYLSNWTQLMLP